MANLASPTGRGGAVLIAADGSSTKRTTPDRLNAGSGSINSTHVLTQTVAKRRSAMTRCMTAFAACLFVFELLRHLVFQGGKFCGELPRGAPVAVLLAGSAHAFNRTHCGLANRVIAPFTRLGHRVVVFAADENGDDDAMVPALERMRKGESILMIVRAIGMTSCFLYTDYPNVDFVIAPTSDSAEDQSSHSPVSTIPDQCVASVEHRFRHMNLGPGSIYAESHQTAAVAQARWVEFSADEGITGSASNKLPGRDAVHASDEKLGAHRKRVVHYMRRLHARKRANDARLKWEKERKENGNGNNVGGGSGSMDKFVWIVYARPDVAFADEVPAERACLPPGGRRVHVPWFHSRGALILLLVWAIRLTSCFGYFGIYRGRERSVHDGSAGGRFGVLEPVRLDVRRTRGVWGGVRGSDPSRRGFRREGPKVAPKAKARHGGPVASVQLCVLPSAERVSIRGESLLVILVILVILVFLVIFGYRTYVQFD